MNVTYSPSLMAQIRGRKSDSRRVCVIRKHGHFVPRVDPVTRKATNEPQQFYIDATDARSLSPVPMDDCVDSPIVIDADTVSYR